MLVRRWQWVEDELIYGHACISRRFNDTRRLREGSYVYQLKLPILHYVL